MKKQPQQNSRAGVAQIAAAGFLGLLTLLLPAKFAGLAVMPEATSFFPGYWSAYIDITWPAHSFGLFSGVALFVALAVFGWRLKTPPFRSAAGRCALLWAFGLPIAALPGLLNCETLDYAIWEIFHLAGIGAYLWALYLVLSSRPEWRGIYVWLLLAGAGYAVYAGLRQYFVGFAEMRDFMQQQYEAGIRLGNVMRSKLEDDRVFGSFASCNVLAGYLILLLPLAGWRLWVAGERFEPARVSKPLLCGIGCVLLGAVLLLTRGRGALLAAVLAAGGFVLTLPMRRLWRAGLILAAVAVIAGGALFANYVGRGFGSVEERVDYLKTSARMVIEKPVAGYGWGGFFYRHMELKTSDTDEAAHDPHNIVASFATQAGVPAGLLVVLILCWPMWELGRRVLRRRAGGFEQAVFWGEVAFLLHALMDVDLQIPANMAIAGGLLVAALIRPESESDAGGAEVREESPDSVPVRCRRAARLLWLLPGAVLGATAFGGGIYVMRSEQAFDDLLKLIQPQSTDDLKLRPTPAGVERALRNAVELRPYSPFPWENAGDFYLAVRDVRNAERCYREAMKRTSARPSTYERLSRIERMRGNREEAKRFLLEACRRFPGNPKYTEELKERYPEVEFPQ